MPRFITHIIEEFYTAVRKRNIKVLLVQFTGLALVFLSNLLMVKLFGENVYGTYSLIMSWVSLLCVISLFGIDNAHATNIPGYRLNKQKDAIKAQLGWSLQVNFIALAGVSALLYGSLYVFKFPLLVDYSRYIGLAIIIIGLFTFINNLLGFLRSFDKILLCEIIDKAGKQIVFAPVLILFYYIPFSDKTSAILTANIISLGAVLLMLGLFVKTSLSPVSPVIDKGKISPSIYPNIRYVSLSLLYLLSVRIDILLLGVLSGPLLVGHYNIATKFSDIVSYPLAIANLTLPVLLAKHIHRNDGQETPSLLKSISKAVFYQSLLISLMIAAGGYFVLSWYGEGFKNAFPAMIILLVNNLMGSFATSIDVFFILRKREKQVIVCRVLSIALLFVFAYILIPVYGITGAALSTVLGNFFYHCLLQYLFYRKYGFIVHPFHSPVKSR